MNKDKNCILCPYKKEENCIENHSKCYSLSNIYYGIICNHFPFKQIDIFITEHKWRKYNKECEKMDNKYGDFALENDDLKFIWGVKSWDDLCDSDANFMTMNDIDIIYDKKENVYALGIETAYMFKDGYKGECEYLKQCLNAFTKYMDDNGLDKNKEYMFFMSNSCTSMEAETIEELYTNFRIFVNGYCSLGGTRCEYNSNVECENCGSCMD